jgi:molybdate transport system substrate-binding protein
MIRRLLFVALVITTALPAAAPKPAVSIAAAANLVYALEALNAEFKLLAPDVTLTSSTGASGGLFAQIKNGAPFDVFLSADTDYPQRLVAEKAASAASLRTFARGRLVFWTTRTGLDVQDIAAAVRDPGIRKIAVAQPTTAPYGRAAQAALEQLGVWRDARPKMVFGENITQTAQFVETGNADAGFVALSIVVSPRLAHQGRWVEVPRSLHPAETLDHAGVLTTRGADNPAARRYLEFLGSAAARKILRDFGYAVPETP